MTRQVVWPQELLFRRSAAMEVARRLRAAEQEPPGADAALLASRLHAELAVLPCPHWDLSNDPADLNDWVCETCGDIITPEWVALGEQEHQLRRHQLRRSEAWSA